MSPQHVVAVVAHPDDAELLCFGTLLKLVGSGAAVSVLAVSDGRAGLSLADEEAGRRLATGERWREMQEAFAGSGIEVGCLGLPDGELQCDRSLITAIERVLISHSCTMLFTHCAGAASDHQDHRAVGAAAVNAATRVTTCQSILHGEPHAPFSSFAPTVFFDVTDEIPEKIRALESHRSQAGRWYLSEDYIRHRAEAAAWRSRPKAAAAGRLFEAFECSFMLDPGALEFTG